MALQHYINQIEVLLLTGRLQGSAILELHQQLRACIAGKVSDKELQAKIEQYGRDDEPIASPMARLTKAQQLELLLWHPLFTGLCPQCRHSFSDVQGRVHWDCPNCGWMDDTA